MALVDEDSVLSLLWHGFDPWPGNFFMLPVQPKKKINKKVNEIERKKGAGKNYTIKTHNYGGG